MTNQVMQLSRKGTETAKSSDSARHLSIVSPSDSEANQSPKTAKSNLPPRRKTNKEVRDREYLTPDEVKLLFKAARQEGRHKLRDECLVMVAFYQALRVGELVDLRWTDIDFAKGMIYVRRTKGSEDSHQYLTGDQLRRLRELKRKSKENPFVFLTERNTPISDRHVRTIVKNLGERVGLMNIHPHMLRHARGYHLANEGTDFRLMQGLLGHKNPTHTSHYTKLNHTRYRAVAVDI